MALHVAMSLESILPGVAPVIRQLSEMVDHGHFGKKSGLGFYRYKKGKRVGVSGLAGRQVQISRLQISETTFWTMD